MPLVACPDCDHQISDASPACMHCGRPMAVAVPAIAPLPAAPVHHGPSCQSCGSADVARLQVIWEGGTSNIDTRTRSSGIGIGIGTGGLGIGVGGGGGRTKGVAQTLAGQRAAPPARKGMSLKFALVAILVGPMLLAAMLGEWAAVLVLPLLLGYGIYCIYWNNTTWPRLYQAWQSRWMCRACGVVFLPGGLQATVAAAPAAARTPSAADRTCLHCGYLNSSSRQSCKSCRQPL